MPYITAIFTVAILPIPILMTPTLPVLGSAAPCLWNDFAQIFRCEQDLSVPIWVAGKGEQIFSRCSVRGADQILMAFDQFYVTSETSHLLL